MSPAATPRRRSGNVTELNPKTKPAPKPSSSRTKPADLKKPPAWLSPAAALVWRHLVPDLEAAFPDGALTTLDIPALGLMLEHYAIAASAAEALRDGAGKHQPIDTDSAHPERLRKAPASQIMRDHGKAFVELAREYGLTMRSRSLLNVESLGGYVPDGDEDDDLFET
jgi:P27 family predicted phage terminase small subunit